MNWRIKVIGFKILSAVPGGSVLYRFAQKHLTKSLVLTRERALNKIEVGSRYHAWLMAHGAPGGVENLTHLDFGSGWHPTIPLLFYELGARRQFLLDVKPILDSALLSDTMGFVSCLQSDPEWPREAVVRRPLPKSAGKDLEATLATMGMSYLAPYAGTFAKLRGEVDLATSTQVLFHLPRAAVAETMRNLLSVLKPGGLFMGTLHLRDILSGNLNKPVSKFHQFEYSPETWERWFCSDLMAYNRLRARDYRQLLEAAGFKILHFDVTPGIPQDFQELDATRIAACFKGYSREEMAARHLFFVAQKP